MFESDDFDQVLSQFDFPPDVSSKCKPTETTSCCDRLKTSNTNTDIKLPSQDCIKHESQKNELSPCSNSKIKRDNLLPVLATPNASSSNVNIFTPKHTKRKIINTFFDPKSKRKFPGPAGLLTGSLDESKEENFSHVELLSQDMEFSQNNIKRDLFECPLWMRLLEDVKRWKVDEIDSIKAIKQQALAGNLPRRKARTVVAFVEVIDRSVIDPLVILRDNTGTIKCTLHRDAWSKFSPYLVSEYCALILWKPTVLTTGGAFKKHYLNITLSNIYAIYSSTVLDTDEHLPNDYITVYEDNFTVMKVEVPPNIIEPNLTLSNEERCNANDLLDGLDSIFSDDTF